MDLIQFIPPVIATVGSIQMAVIDIKQFRIPNKNLLITTFLVALTMTLVSIIDGRFTALLLAILGSIMSLLLFLFVHAINPKGLGMGDVKFAGLLGLTMSWLAFPVALRGFVFAFAATTIFAFFAMIFKRVRKNTLIPFAPFMVLGLLVVEFQYLAKVISFPYF